MTPEREPLTDAEVRALVQKAIDDKRPVDHVFAEFFFGHVDAKPLYWADWPEPVRDAWHRAAYHALDIRRTQTSSAKQANPRKRRRQYSKFTGERPDAEAFYRTFALLAPDDSAWWRLPFVAWPAIAAELGVPSSNAAYLARTLGFRLAGLKSHRHVKRAPCLKCGSSVAPELLDNEFHCTRCSD